MGVVVEMVIMVDKMSVDFQKRREGDKFPQPTHDDDFAREPALARLRLLWTDDSILVTRQISAIKN